jgi:ATP-dependent DNA helicase DinG
VNGAFLSARVDRPGGVRVLVPLHAQAETIFLESDESEPDESLRVRAHAAPDAASRRGPMPRDGMSLLDVLWTLWPAGSRAVEARLQATLAADNRLDMEADLSRWADLLEALLAWWQQQDEPTRRVRVHRLARTEPALAELLALPVPPEAAKQGRRTGAPPWAMFEGLFLAPRPVVPTIDEESWRGWTSRDLPADFGPHGGLRQLLGEGFEPRSGQLDMAERLAETLDARQHLLVEAGTGIGKSLAYLVPALLHAARHGERLIVSTFTKALQSQLMDKDLPLLARLGFPGRARLLLGRNNYLCRRQLRRALRSVPDDPLHARAQLALAMWSLQSEEGQRAELADHPWFEVFWKPFFESVEPCSPHICHPEPACFVVRARRAAREAHVVVVNHSLLMMDLKSGQTLMGPARLLVVDEAHQLPRVATMALGRRLAPERLEVYRNLTGDRERSGGLREVLDLLAREAERVHVEDVAEAARHADRILEEFLRAFTTWFHAVDSVVRQRLGTNVHRAGDHRIHDGDEAFGDLRSQSGTLQEAGERLDLALAALLASGSRLEDHGCDVEDEREGLASLLEFHRDTAESIRFCLRADDEDWVYWLEWGGDAGLRGLVAAPLTVEAPLAELWERYFDSVVFTSATLAVGEDFGAFRETVGMTRPPRPAFELQIPSPFYHDDQALILTSLDLPPPDDAEFPAKVASVVASIATAEPTKILVLSTSYRLVEQIGEELGALLGQGNEGLFAVDASRASVATGSFWEGVDFPGRELEVLVVPRLPFAVPTEPLIEGRYDRAKRLGRDPFTEVALSDAVLRLKQGIGRLLRSSEDRGVVLLLDQRLQTKAYGVSFLQSLPRTCELAPVLDEMAPRVVDFLREGRARARGGRAG